jgi:hypothetical protein
VTLLKALIVLALVALCGLAYLAYRLTTDIRFGRRGGRP